MAISILHYHLQPGGVTRVIASQVQALRERRDAGDVKVLTGRAPNDNEPGFDDVDIVTHAALGYLDQDVTAADSAAIRNVLLTFLRDQVAPDDILHVHNHALGKNPALTQAIHDLVAEGRRVFLHCHDFIEDRPDNLAFAEKVIGRQLGSPFPDVLYPRQRRCFYGTINSFDRGRLLGMGLPESQVFLLPNAVAFPGETTSENSHACRMRLCHTLGLSGERPVFVYPVRPIRRKNLGEFILFAALFAEKADWLVTLAPLNPVEHEVYLRWKTFAAEIGAGMHFEVGTAIDFPTVMRGADRIITTSVREGFGMAFLEPWLFGKPVAGRNIPAVTTDFLAAGIELPCLYDELPLATPSGRIDFAQLAMDEQMEAIGNLLSDRQARRAFLAESGVEATLYSDVPPDVIRRNCRVLETDFSVCAYGDRLADIYRTLAAAP